MYPFLEIITRISTLIPVLSSWETCALSLIEKTRPSGTYFFCKSLSQCPSRDFYKQVDIPTQTVYDLETQFLPMFRYSELVFITAHDEIVGWNNETIQKYRLGGYNEFKLVIIADIRKNIEDSLWYMKKLFEAFWESGLANSVVMLKNETLAQIFTYLPFKSDGPCEDTSPVILGECTAIAQTVFREKVTDMNHCPTRIALGEDQPLIGFPLSGRLAFLVKEMALRMNSTLKTMKPKHSAVSKACGESEFSGMRGDVVQGKFHMGLGTFHPQACAIMAYVSLSYYHCLAWCTPVLKSTEYIYVFIAQQLQPTVWAALLSTTFLVVASVLVLSSLAQERVSAHCVVYLAFLLFTVVPIKHFRRSPVRLVLAIWLWACLVVQTVYQGELKSQSAVPLGEHIIEELDELLHSKLQLLSTSPNLEWVFLHRVKLPYNSLTAVFHVYLFSFSLLRGVDEPEIQMITQKTQILNTSIHKNILTAAKLRDRAIFTSNIRCSLAASELGKGANSLYSTTGGCFKSYQLSPIVTIRGSPFKRIWETIMQRTIESGLFQKWLDIKSAKIESGRVRALSLEQLLPTLFVLALGCSCSLLAFLMEYCFYTRSAWYKLCNCRNRTVSLKSPEDVQTV